MRIQFLSVILDSFGESHTYVTGVIDLEIKWWSIPNGFLKLTEWIRRWNRVNDQQLVHFCLENEGWVDLTRRLNSEYRDIETSN